MEKPRFIHITKTGGRSIIETCGSNIFIPRGGHPHHVPFQEGDLDRETFAVVRNPYSRVESLYNFYKYKRDVVNKNHSFRDFVINYDSYYNEAPTHPNHTFKTCFDYLSWEGEIKTKHILKFETLQGDWKAFATKFNLPINLKHSNSNNKKEDVVWDDEMKGIIQEIYKNDFLTFNYK
jgi:hypothetical protein